MKISTAKNGNVTITGINAGDLRLWGNLIEEGSFTLDQGGPRSKMARRLSRLFFSAAQFPTLRPITCAPSTSNPDECYIDDEDILTPEAQARWDARLARNNRIFG